MLNLSPEKILLVGVIALIVLGPNRLPHAARTVAKLLHEVRKVSGSFQEEVRGALAEPHDALNRAVGDFGLGDIRSTVRSTVNEAVSPLTRPLAAPTPAPADGAAAATSAAPPSPDDPALN